MTSVSHHLTHCVGSFNVVFLYILAFNTHSRQLNVIGRTDAFGPHQYLAKSPARDRLYTTTWAWPPSLNSWYIDWNEWDEDEWFPTLEHLNTVPISETFLFSDLASIECTTPIVASTSSYITLTDTRIYSAGGPTGEVHEIDSDTGGFGKKIQDLAYVDEDQLPWEDKTRKALVSSRSNGSFSIESFVKDSCFGLSRETVRMRSSSRFQTWHSSLICSSNWRYFVRSYRMLTLNEQGLQLDMDV